MIDIEQYPVENHFTRFQRASDPAILNPTESRTPPTRGRVSRPLRVAFLTPTLLMGGAERWMVSMARRCDPRRIRWTGTVLSDGAPANVDIIREMSAFMAVFAGINTPVASDCSEVVRCETTWHAIKRATDGADLLIAWGLPNLAQILDGISTPVVFVSHGAGEWTARAVQSSESACAHFVAVSETALQPFGPRTRASARVLHNGIDVERCSPRKSRSAARASLGIGSDEIALGYVGRFSFEKNPLAVAYAVRELKGNYRAVYCGEGWREAEVRAAATEIAGDRVLFVPHQRLVGDVLQALDVFVLASPAEGFSLSLTEAWYASVPTVATRVGAVPELEREFGQLVSAVPINARPGNFAYAVQLALSPGFRETIVPRAHEMVAQHFTANAMALRWTDYLESVCS